MPGNTLFVALFLAVACGSTFGQSLEQRPVESDKAAIQQSSSGMDSSHGPKSAVEPRVIPIGTALQVQTLKRYPMKQGVQVETRLLHPVFVEEKLLLPAGTEIRGTVTSLSPDRAVRVQGRLRGDFTPFHKANLLFTQLVRPHGETLPIHTTQAVTGAPLLQIEVAHMHGRQSFFGRLATKVKATAHQQLSFFIDPGLGSRMLQLLYMQLPYHPEGIRAKTAWSFEVADAVKVPEFNVGAASISEAALKPQTTGSEYWTISAVLKGEVSSATAKLGDSVEAFVVEPVYDRNHELVVPQGSTLTGKVVVARAARFFGRNGRLRFNFQRIRFPAGKEDAVAGTLGGASTDQRQGLMMDAEGGVKPANRSSIVIPLALTMLAGRALDGDGNIYAQTGVASNGFGLAGRLTGIFAGSRNLAAGIGYYAAALSVYDNFIRRGQDVVFEKDTRVEIITTPLRSVTLRPDAK